MLHRNARTLFLPRCPARDIEGKMKNTVWMISACLLGLGCPLFAQTVNFVAAQRSSQTKKLNVAIFVFPVVQTIDFAGPYEVFSQAGTNVYTVAEKLDPIQTAAGLLITPKYTFADAPKPDVLVLPGGNGVAKQLANPVAMRWIQETAKAAPQTLTVCTGALLAGKAGLLDGLSATTFYGALDSLSEYAPHTKIVWDKKYVDSGRVITTAGLSSGMEGSLYTVSKLMGMGLAQSIALHIEYNWNPESTYARAMFPDMYIPDELPYGLPKGSDLLSSAGDRDRWTITVRIPGEQGTPKLLENINASIAKSGKWARAINPPGENASRWEFTDRYGAKWQSVITLAPEKSSDLLFTLKMHRI
jgi:putative intracellular protease/amidase